MATAGTPARLGCPVQMSGLEAEPLLLRAGIAPARLHAPLAQIPEHSPTHEGTTSE